MRWQVSVLFIVLAVGAVLVKIKLPVHSDDGPGTGSVAFQSPLLIWKYPPGGEACLATDPSTPGDLLTNGDMDQKAFYWRYPNHWIPGGWFEWFSMCSRIPEFNNGNERGFVHSDPSSQRLQLWGGSYAGGLMQSVVVTPCVNYQFQGYGQSRPGTGKPPLVPVNAHMKLGIEPYGWMSGRSLNQYDPVLEPEEFPDTVIWSPEVAQPYYVFEPITVTTEALSNTVTVILFSNPEVDPPQGVWWHDTVWDTASLVPVPPPSGLLLDDALPEFDDLISQLSVTISSHLTIVEWDTAVPASSQVIYRLLSPSTSISVTKPVSYSIYLPKVAKPLDPSAFSQHSAPDVTPVTHHRVELTGLPESPYAIEFMALSRRLVDEACVTSASEIIRAESQAEGQAHPGPDPGRGK